MSDFQKIKINNVQYDIIDSIQDFRAEDSFIHRKNKLKQFKGNGESKKHIGTYKGDIGKRMSHFFNYASWGLEHSDKNRNGWKTIHSARESGAIVQEGTCFFTKNNLLKYLQDAKIEYFSQEQLYHNDISQYFENRIKRVETLSDEEIFFTIYDASDNVSQKQNRGYIRSDDSIWDMWRELILPGISYLSILKIIPSGQTIENSIPLFYFRILLDYHYRSFVHPLALDMKTTIQNDDLETTLLQKRIYRQGAIRYRKDVLEYMPQCPFSKLTDERLLIASHIKPYNICIKENREDQALDHLNGLSLSPTYDKLFDQGYITFTNEGELICGTQLSSYTWEKLNINPNAKNKMRIHPENREEYLEYHRLYVFLDDIQNMV